MSAGQLRILRASLRTAWHFAQLLDAELRAAFWEGLLDGVCKEIQEHRARQAIEAQKPRSSATIIPLRRISR